MRKELKLRFVICFFKYNSEVAASSTFTAWFSYYWWTEITPMILLSLTSYLTNFVCFPMFWTITEIPCDKKNIHLFWASLVSKPLVVPEGCSARMFFQGWISSALFSIGMLIVGVMIAVHFLAPWLHGTSSSHPSHPWDPPKPLVALLVAPPVWGKCLVCSWRCCGRMGTSGGSHWSFLCSAVHSERGVGCLQELPIHGVLGKVLQESCCLFRLGKELQKSWCRLLLNRTQSLTIVFQILA